MPTGYEMQTMQATIESAKHLKSIAESLKMIAAVLQAQFDDDELVDNYLKGLK
jgi:hypothetical protein